MGHNHQGNQALLLFSLLLLFFTVADEAIALHLAEAQTALARPALARLPRQVGLGAARARMDLIEHHVLQLLVVDRAKEDVRAQRLACVAGRRKGEVNMPKMKHKK